jgi:hypothetical protein
VSGSAWHLQVAGLRTGLSVEHVVGQTQEHIGLNTKSPQVPWLLQGLPAQLMPEGHFTNTSQRSLFLGQAWQPGAASPSF